LNEHGLKTNLELTSNQINIAGESNGALGDI
jgi:hypothetical protein